MKAPIFRFWDLVSQVYRSPSFLIICGGKIFRKAFCNLHETTFDITEQIIPEMQSPFQDIDGTYIFDGDFIRVENILDGYVTYESGLFHIITEELVDYVLLCDNFKECKILGNIHENIGIAPLEVFHV